MLFNELFDHRFAALEKLECVDWNQIEAWKRERTDIPTDEEVQSLFADDLQRFADIAAVEISGRKYFGRLVPVARKLPQTVRAWGEVKRSSLFVENGVHYFVGRKGEKVRLTYTPFDSGHTVDCRWTLKRIDGKEQMIAKGEVKAERGQPAAIDLMLHSDGVYAFDRGTDYWKAAQIEFDERPLSVWCGRHDEPSEPRRKPLQLWFPRGEPLYFFVPKGTKHFVIGIVAGGDPYTDLVVETADGTVVARERVVSKDQISVIVDEDIRQYGVISEMGKQAVLPAHEKPVVVPKGKSGQIWRLRLNSLRCIVELYDVPPYLARHPAELLIPEDALR
jgi:hypothetical protein